MRSLLKGLTTEEKAALNYRWEFWARPDQLEPEGDWWTVWLALAGRGWGKTRCGAEWVRQIKNEVGRIGLIAPTAADARDVMVEGESGIMAISPPWDRPLFEPSKRRLTWDNGAMATLYSADEPDRLRGPQHAALWCDELAAWKYMQEAWDMAMFGLRLGNRPKVCATTTPRPMPLIRELLKSETTVVSRGRTYDNLQNLAPAFRQAVLAKYEGTRLGRQELNAEVLDDVPGALWTRQTIEDALWRGDLPDMKRIVVAVDPSGASGTDGEKADSIGIVAAGLRAAFLDSIDGITDRVTLREIARLLEGGEVEALLDYLRINRLSFQGLEIAMRDMFEAGGLRFAQGLPTLAQIVFDVRNPEAENWIRQKSGDLVAGIVQGQRDMIRSHLVEGLARGDNPRQTAVELVGRISKASGKREGGVIGLTAQQEQFQAAYAAELASDDPRLLKQALGRQLRDKRFDRAITKAIREGKPIPAETRRKMIRTYRNRMLKYRADMIARTETLQSLAGSEYETYRQAVLSGELRADQIDTIWDDVGDSRVRFSHRILGGQVKQFGEAFISPLGSRMKHPGDTTLGARKEDIIGCRCRLRFRVRFE